MFSVTGNILPGSALHPNACTLIVPFSKVESLKLKESENIVPALQNPGSQTLVAYEFKNDISCWHSYGSILPVVSTFTGIAQAFLGTVHAIAHLVLAIFDSKNRLHHMKEAELGAKNVAYGSLYALPIIGNIASLFINGLLLKENGIAAVNSRASDHDHFCQYVLLIEDGEITKEMPILEFKKLVLDATPPERKFEILRSYQKA